MAKNKEWEKEMMKWSKQNLINLLEKVISEGKQQATNTSRLNIPCVTQQRELLIDFADCIQSDTGNFNYTPEQWVELYLEGNL